MFCAPPPRRYLRLEIWYNCYWCAGEPWLLLDQLSIFKHNSGRFSWWLLQTALRRRRQMHIHSHCWGTVFSHDLFSLANRKETCCAMINGHDYLLWKCGFLAQQLHFYDLNPRRDAPSCRQSCRRSGQRACGADQACLPSALCRRRQSLLTTATDIHRETHCQYWPPGARRPCWTGGKSCRVLMDKQIHQNKPIRHSDVHICTTSAPRRHSPIMNLKLISVPNTSTGLITSVPPPQANDSSSRLSVSKG